MAHNYSLIIHVKGAATGSQAPNGDSPTGESEVAQKATGSDGSALKQVARKVAGFYAATSLVRNMVKTEIGLMDVYTGNDYQQRVIEGGINISETLIGTGIAFAINPVAGVAAVASKAISLGAEARRKGVELYTQSLEAGLVRERAGGAFNRSRISGKF